MNIEKVIKKGKVAVLVSPGFGAGWSTWSTEHPDLVFSPKVVEMVLKGKRDEITDEWVKENLGYTDVYTGGAGDLEVVWLKEGTKFYIDEYDGSESIVLSESLTMTA